MWVAVVLLLGPLFVVMAVLRNQKRLSLVRSETVELRVDAFGVRRCWPTAARRASTGATSPRSRCSPPSRGRTTHRVASSSSPATTQSGCLVPLDQLETAGWPPCSSSSRASTATALTEAVTRRAASPHQLLGPTGR